MTVPGLSCQKQAASLDLDIIIGVPARAERSATRCPRKAGIGWQQRLLAFRLAGTGPLGQCRCRHRFNGCGRAWVAQQLGRSRCHTGGGLFVRRFFRGHGIFLISSRKEGRRESGPADSRPGWIRQTIASDPDVSASAGTQPPGVRIGTGCMRARRRSSIGGRPWPTPHES